MSYSTSQSPRIRLFPGGGVTSGQRENKGGVLPTRLQHKVTGMHSGERAGQRKAYAEPLVEARTVFVILNEWLEDIFPEFFGYHFAVVRYGKEYNPVTGNGKADVYFRIGEL